MDKVIISPDAIISMHPMMAFVIIFCKIRYAKIAPAGSANPDIMV